MVAKMVIKSFRTTFDYVQILKTLKKPFKRLEEEGTLIASHDSKSEWHLAKVVQGKHGVVGARTQGRTAKGRALGLLETFFEARNFVFWNKTASIHKTIPLIVYVTMIIEGNSFSI